MSGWIGVDLDGTLARYDGWMGPTVIGEPVPAMLARVKAWLSAGREVRIFTARIHPIYTILADEEPPPIITADVNPERDAARVAVMAIKSWCREHLGRELTITCVKDYGMVELYDDRAVQVKQNTGELVGFSTRV